MNLTGQVKLSISLTGTKSFDVDISHDATDALVINDTKKVTNGAGNLQGNILWHDKRSLSSGGSDNLDLAGVLEDAFGDVVSAARAKLIYIKNLSTTNRLRIGGAASNPISTLFVDSADAIVLRPGGRFFIDAWDATGYVITAGSADVLRITHMGDTTAAAEYDIVIAGASS